MPTASPTALYDQIGTGYSVGRRPDPRLAAALAAALGDAATVVNVGAGAGAYEPRRGRVIAIEPSLEMIRQRAPDAALCIQASAESIPLGDDMFDAAMAVLTVHHWADWRAGVRELRRVARRVVVLTWDPAFALAHWLTERYLPEAADLDRARFAPLGDVVAALGAARVEVVPIPHDCIDGFYGAYWRRPAAYLDPLVRDGISVLRQLSPATVARALAALSDDLRTGAWAARSAALLERDALDLGYRLVVADRG